MVPGQQGSLLMGTNVLGSPFGMGRRCAVLGSPITHSLSPALHRAAYATLGLDWEYTAVEVDEDALSSFLDGLEPAWRGLSLTMPLKRVALDICTRVDYLAERVGAVNTMVFEADGTRYGTNTDVAGMVAAFRERGVDRLGSAIVLGVGATACSAVAALAVLGVRTVHGYARDPARGDAVRAVGERFGVEVDIRPWSRLTDGRAVEPADVAVSTVPADAAEPVAEPVAGAVEVVFEVLYHPWPTPFAATAQSLGRRVIGGLDLLIHQAALQVELMTGREPAPITAMRAAGEQALAVRR